MMTETEGLASLEISHSASDSMLDVTLTPRLGDILRHYRLYIFQVLFYEGKMFLHVYYRNISSLSIKGKSFDRNLFTTLFGVVVNVNNMAAHKRKWTRDKRDLHEQDYSKVIL